MDMNEDKLNAEPKDFGASASAVDNTSKNEELKSKFDSIKSKDLLQFTPDFHPPVIRSLGRPRGRRRGRPSWKASKANYFETRPIESSTEQNSPSPKELFSLQESEVISESQNIYQNEEKSFQNESFVGESLNANALSSSLCQEQENLSLEVVGNEVKEESEEEEEEENNMVGKGGGGEKKKLLEMMSMQFNASDIPEKASGEGGSKRGRRGGARIGRPPKRKSDPGPIVQANSDSGSSLASVNPITHALKKVRKEKSFGNTMPLPFNVSRIRRHPSDVHRSGSEKDSAGDDSNSLPEGAEIEGGSGSNVKKKIVGRPRKKKTEIEIADTDSPVMAPETSLPLDSNNYQDNPRNVRGSRSFRRGRGRLNSLGRGRESPRSESSVDSVLSRQKGRPSSVDEYISDGGSTTTIRGRGKYKSLQSSPQSRGLIKGMVGRRSGRHLHEKNVGRTSIEPANQRRSATPVTSEVEENTDETVEAVAPRKIGRPRKHEEIPMVDSPGQTPGSLTKTGKKKKKHFKGLKYSFVKKKKKPKLLKSHLEVQGMDNTQETESLASEDVDGDSLDSSSQDLSRRLLLLPGELDPYDPSAEFDDSQSEKSIPLSLQQQRRAYQRKGKEEIEEDDHLPAYNRDEEEVDEDEDVEESGVEDWRLFAQENEDNADNGEEYEDEDASNNLENEDDAENEEMEVDNEEEEDVANEEEELGNGEEMGNEEEEEEEEEVGQEEEEIVGENEEYENEDRFNDESNFVVEDEHEGDYEVQNEEYEDNNDELEEENECVNEDENQEETHEVEYNQGGSEEVGQEYEENGSYTEDQDQVYEEEEVEEEEEQGEEQEEEERGEEQEEEEQGEEQEEEEQGEEQEVVEPEEMEQEEQDEEVEEEEEEEDEEEEREREIEIDHEEEEPQVEQEEEDAEEVEQEEVEQDVEEGQVDEMHEMVDQDEIEQEEIEGDFETKPDDLIEHDEEMEGIEDENVGSEENEHVLEDNDFAEDEKCNTSGSSPIEEEKMQQEPKTSDSSLIEEEKMHQEPKAVTSEMQVEELTESVEESSCKNESEVDVRLKKNAPNESKEATLSNGNKLESNSMKKLENFSDPLERKSRDIISGRRNNGCKRRLEEAGHDCPNSDSCDSSDKGGVVRKSKRLNRHSGGGPHSLAIGAPTSTMDQIADEKLNELQELSLADPSLTNVLCKCRVKENPRAVNLTGDIYCQAIDSFDGRMIGCCNTVTNYRYLRVSGKIPFMLLCPIHRQRIRRHNCCPGCGLFCTQGVFSECRWDKLGSRHYYHKLCGLLINGVSLCPHCGTDQPSAEIHLELKLSRKPVIYIKQHQEKKGFTSSARMEITKNANVEPVPVAPEVESPENPILELGNGKVISASKLPVGLDKQQLLDAINAIKRGKVINVKAAPKGIYWSCKQGDLEKLLHVLVKGLNPNSKVKEYGNQCGLHTASTHGCLAAIHVLVLAGAYLDYTDSQLQTPLMIAILKGHNDIINYLIQAGASLNFKTQEGMTCLHLAAKAGNYLACQYILDSGRLNRLAINVQDEGGWTPLVWASENRCISVVKILLERGANPQICDVEQNTALHWAAFSGSTHICSMVLDRGCSLRSMNAIGDTPLHIAARQNHVEAVMLLLARGAILDIKNSKGQTPLECAYPESDVFLQLSLKEKLKEALDEIGMKTERILSSDIAAGKESVPILCVNGVDEGGLPKDYIYIAENCEAFNVNIDRTIASLKWCECEDGCNTESCICTQLNFQCWYDPEGRLLNDFNYADPPMIFECNRACGCSKLSCHNRVVQHRMTAHLQLFKTCVKGWAVRALNDIPKGSYVCEYVGEIITDLEADQREDDSYLFDLDNRDSETFCIDARQYGNVARFINHSCNPNLTPVKIFIDHQDLIFPRIAFFANRDIEADEELGFDYGEKFWVIKYKHFTCMCGSAKCKYSSETIQSTLEIYNKKMLEHQLQQEKLVSGTSNVHD